LTRRGIPGEDDVKQKVGIVGSGHVGSEVANEIVRMNIADCVLIDTRGDEARAKALDLSHSAPIRHSSASVTRGDGWANLAGCRVIVMAAGVPRVPGMTREDLLDTNCAIVREIVPEIVEACPDAVLLVVTNPLDAVTYCAWRLSGKEPSAVLGMAGALDSTRFRWLLASTLNVSADDVHAMVLGSHGDLMVPLARFASVAGIPAVDLIDWQDMERLIERTKNAGTELVSLLKSGSAYYAAGAATAAVVDSIVNDRRRVLCSSTLCNGQYGIDGICIGVPTVIGSSGVERIIELPLNEEELRALHASAEHLARLQERVDALYH
jgi:malate dehydrogenase